jgi:hypothetical protein
MGQTLFSINFAQKSGSITSKICHGVVKEGIWHGHDLDLLCACVCEVEQRQRCTGLCCLLSWCQHFCKLDTLVPMLLTKWTWPAITKSNPFSILWFDYIQGWLEFFYTHKLHVSTTIDRAAISDCFVIWIHKSNGKTSRRSNGVPYGWIGVIDSDLRQN